MSSQRASEGSKWAAKTYDAERSVLQKVRESVRVQPKKDSNDVNSVDNDEILTARTCRCAVHLLCPEPV